MLDRVFEKLQLEQILRVRIELFALDSTSVKVHPDGTGALRKTGRSRSKMSRGRNTRNHLLCRGCSNGRELPAFCRQRVRCAGERELLRGLGPMLESPPLWTDRAYEDAQTRALARSLGMVPVVPAKRDRCTPMSLRPRALQRRNETERRFKGFRRVFTRFENSTCSVSASPASPLWWRRCGSVNRL